MEGKLQSKMKVAVRVRPALNREDHICVSTDRAAITIFNQKNINENITYKSPTIFDINSNQKDVYADLVQPEVNHILEGKNVSIFAYGASGSGKTHTMLGSPVDPGIIPRLIQDLFDSFPCQTEHSYKMSFSYLEICNEKILDLMSDNSENLPIRENVHQNIFVSNLTETEIGSFEDFLKMFGSASDSNRTTATTYPSANSRNSHSILLLKVVKTDLHTLKQCHLSKVFLVDLAGPEDNQLTGNEGSRYKKSALVNKSLFAFVDVIDAINHGNRPILFRSSKLTRLLQNSLCGSSHIVLIVNIAPEAKHYHDTYCSLNFASKQKKIVDNPAVGELATAYNIKLPNSKQMHFIEKDKNAKENTKISLDSAKKLKLSSTGSEQSKSSVVDLKQQMLKMEESLKSQTYLNSKIPAKDQKLELHKVQTKNCTEMTRTRTKIKDDQKSKLKNSRVKQSKSNDRKNLSCLKKDSKKEFTPRYFRSITTKNDYLLIENKQKNHRDDVLKILNSQCEKDLMLLHTVGKNRAQMIIEWSQYHGPFQQIEDLVRIPDLGKKYLTQFLHQNHLLSMDKENL